MRTKKKIASAIVVILSVTTISAQNLIVNLNSGASETFPIENVRSIKFGTCTMILNQMNGGVNFWYLDDITSYSFDAAASIAENNLSSEYLEVFPNPSDGLFNLNYNSSKTESIQLVIVDLNGRQIQEVYKGIHNGTSTFLWQSDVPKGIYLVQLVTETHCITQRIVVR